MCGRFAQVVKHDQLKKLQDELAVKNRDQQIEINLNVRPTQAVAAVIANPEGNLLSFFRWGLIPSWSAELPKFQMINIRSETILEKPTFKTGLLSRRCLIPANGFYEWRKPDKTPFFIHARNPEHDFELDFETRLQTSLLYMAGIYDVWTGADGSYVPSLGIITTSPNRLISSIHDRMPVILSHEDIPTWLSFGYKDGIGLKSMLKACPDEYLDLCQIENSVFG